jgi:enoyl-CoA hydratase
MSQGEPIQNAAPKKLSSTTNDLGEFETVRVVGPGADGVVTITLNRPEKGNAFTRQMSREFTSLVRALRTPPSSVGAVVLTGMGRMFCAGGDVSMIQEFADPAEALWMMEAGHYICADFLSIRPPFVAAVNGHAMGLGATLALLCDIVIMAEDALIADTHVKAGIVAGDGGALLWPLVLGPQRAKEYLFTGEALNAQRALALGLANRVETADAVVEVATAWARRLAAGPRHAIAWTKQAVNIPIMRQAIYTLPLGNAQEARAMTHPDMLEGTAAFLERRPPCWPSAANGGSEST